MHSKLRIILVSPYLPAGDTTGCARKIYDFIRLMNKKGHQINLLSFCSQEDKKRVPSISTFCRKIYLEYLPDYNSFPVQSACFKKAVAELVQQQAVDILQCENSYLRRYFSKRIGILSVLVEHEILSATFRQRCRLTGNYLGRLILSARSIKKIFQERKWYGGFNRIIVFTDEDKKIISSTGKANSEVIPLGIDSQEYLSVTEDKKTYDLIFVGNFSHSPNEDAVLYFYRQILPLIKEELPGVTLLVAGARPSLAVKNLSRLDQQVTVTGYVRDVKCLYAQSRVFIAPLRYGTGMSFKILEALASGTAVVTTPVGARGIIPKQIVKVASDRQEFARAVITLLKSPDLRQEVSLRGRQAVQKLYDWGNLIDKYESIYYSLLHN